MRRDDSDYGFSGASPGDAHNYRCDLDAMFPPETDISQVFVGLTGDMSRFFSISKGLLAIREKGDTRFIATASFSMNKTRRNLSLRIPSVSSLFLKVAEAGATYSENCAEFFSGNTFERNLLFDEHTCSFILQPLKHDGQVVGLLGYSSREPTAFTVFEDGLLDSIAEQLASRIVSRLPYASSSKQ